MNFASFPYLIFLLSCIFTFFYLKKNVRNVFLLLASYFFYATFGFGFLDLMILTTVVTFYSAQFCYNANTQIQKKYYFFTGLFLDLVIFILFKYIHIIDINIMNWPNWSSYKVLIPIGISFYTFKTISYCVDVYQQKYEPEKSIINYALSVSFFPQLIAGPIEKSVVIIKQLESKNEFNIQNILDGGKLILWGLFKKIIIADTIALIINPVFNDIYNYKGLDLAIVFLAFTYQVYTDFSGYSDIAIGSAKCFNVDLPANFNKPFLSKSISEFWRRWHITFYKWFKEYIYSYLLKGNAMSNKFFTAFKVWIIFVLVGLWHGATWNYLCYAMVAFVWMMVDFLTKTNRALLLKKTGLDNSTINRFFSYCIILVMISSFEIFFKFNTIQESLYVFKHIFPLRVYHFQWIQLVYIVLIVCVFEILQSFQLTEKGHFLEGIKDYKIRLVMSLIIIFALIVVGNRTDVSFQYFQF